MAPSPPFSPPNHHDNAKNHDITDYNHNDIISESENHQQQDQEATLSPHLTYVSILKQCLHHLTPNTKSSHIRNLIQFLGRFSDEEEMEILVRGEGGLDDSEEDEEENERRDSDEGRQTNKLATNANLSQQQHHALPSPFPSTTTTTNNPHSAWTAAPSPASTPTSSQFTEAFPPFLQNQGVTTGNNDRRDSDAVSLSDVFVVNEGRDSSVASAGNDDRVGAAPPHYSASGNEVERNPSVSASNDNHNNDNNNPISSTATQPTNHHIQYRLVAYWDPSNATPDQLKMLTLHNQTILKTLRSLGFELGTLPESKYFVIRLDEHELSLNELNFFVAQLEKFLENREQIEKRKSAAASLPKKVSAKKKKTPSRPISPLRRHLQHFLESKKYFFILISFTLAVLGVSVILKLLNYVKQRLPADSGSLSSVDQASVAFAIIYIVSQVFLLIEIIVRMVIFGPLYFYDHGAGNNFFSRTNWRRILDVVIVAAEIVFTFTLLFLWAAGIDFFKNPMDNLGIILFLRLGVFMMYNKNLAGVVTGMMESFGNFTMSFVFLFMVIYMFGVGARVLFSQSCEGLYSEDEYCKRFRDVYESTFSLFQVLSGDSWAEEYARPGQQKLPISYIFFGLFYALTVFVLLNAVSGMVVDSIMSKAKKDEENKRKREEARLMEIEQNLPEVYTAHTTNGSLTGNLKKSVQDRMSSLQKNGATATVEGDGNAELLSEILKRLVRIEEKINYMNHKDSFS